MDDHRHPVDEAPRTAPMLPAAWIRAADWLGGCRPLDLILGAVTIIAAVAALAAAL